MKHAVISSLAAVALALMTSPAPAQQGAPAATGPTSSAQAATGAPDSPPPASSPPAEEQNEGLAERIFGWTAVGVGAAAVVAGGIVAGVAAAWYADLDCPAERCPPELHEDATAYNDLRVPSGLLIFAGAALAGVGLPYVLIGEARADQAAVAPVLAPGLVGLRGRF